MISTMGEPRFLAELGRELAGMDFPRCRVRFLLGSDEDIPQERRVGLVPRHLEALAEALATAGLEPEILVLEGAGDRAGFSDEDYRRAGARLIRRPELGTLRNVDVVHALKEPTEWESELPDPFLRIGAVHLASYPPGVCRLLATKRFAAIFDGGTVGNCSFLKDGGDRTPIVASMSRFAGTVAGSKLVSGLDDHHIGAGKIVVVGGGVAGLAAVDQIRPKLEKLLVIERYPPARERLVGILHERGISNFEILPQVTDAALDDAVGILFAHRSGAKAAEKVCTYDQIRRMRPGAAVIDIAIDQGGSILHDGYSEDDDAHTSRGKYQKLLADYYYYAETNMPREVPREASEMHGEAIAVYIATLLALAAENGGPKAAAAEILRRDVEHLADPASLAGRSLLECLIQDLRNGLQLATDGDRIIVTDGEIERHEALMQWVAGCAG